VHRLSAVPRHVGSARSHDDAHSRKSEGTALHSSVIETGRTSEGPVIPRSGNFSDVDQRFNPKGFELLRFLVIRFLGSIATPSVPFSNDVF